MKKIFITLIALLFGLGTFNYISFARNQTPDATKRILIITDTLQEGTIKQDIAQAIVQAALPNSKVEVTKVAINDLSLPFIQEAVAPALAPINTPEVQAWNTIVSQADGIIFIVPNYNNGYPATIKNAIDVIWKVWFNKPVGIIGYAATQSDDGTDFMKAFTDVLHAIKTDPLATSVYVPSAAQKKANQTLVDEALQQKLARMVDEMYLAVKQPSYFKQLARNIGDSIKKRLIGLQITYMKWQKKRAESSAKTA